MTDVNLASFPMLADWYAQAQRVGTQGTSGANVQTKLAFCRALCQDLPQRYRTWRQAFARLLTQSHTAADDLDELDRFFASKGLLVSELTSALAHFAVTTPPYAQDFINLMSEAATRSNLPAYYFVAAWAAFNADDCPRCLALCAQAPEPLQAPLAALKGQALLESGDQAGAVVALREATQLAPHDVMMWFQLAKAEMVNANPTGAWQALMVCQELSPQHPEVALFCSVLANAPGAPKAWQELAWQSLSAHLANQNVAQAGIVLPLIRLAANAGEKPWAATVIGQSNWRQLAGELQRLGELKAIFLELGKQGWYDLALEISEGLAGLQRQS